MGLHDARKKFAKNLMSIVEENYYENDYLISAMELYDLFIHDGFDDNEGVLYLISCMIDTIKELKREVKQLQSALAGDDL